MGDEFPSATGADAPPLSDSKMDELKEFVSRTQGQIATHKQKGSGSGGSGSGSGALSAAAQHATATAAKLKALNAANAKLAAGGKQQQSEKKGKSGGQQQQSSGPRGVIYLGHIPYVPPPCPLSCSLSYRVLPPVMSPVMSTVCPTYCYCLLSDLLLFQLRFFRGSNAWVFLTIWNSHQFTTCA